MCGKLFILDSTYHVNAHYPRREASGTIVGHQDAADASLKQASQHEKARSKEKEYSNAAERNKASHAVRRGVCSKKYETQFSRKCLENVRSGDNFNGIGR